MNEVFSQLLWGGLQGATEFLPVSSSAHLVFLSSLISVPFGLPRLYFFTALHFGTVLALVVYFRRMLWDYIAGVFTDVDTRKFIAKLFVGCVVTGMVGLSFEGWANLFSQQPRIVAGILFSMGLALFSTRFILEGSRSMKDLTLPEAVLLGLIQGIAVFPGISRSGITIILLLFLRFKAQDAFNLSFLVGIPVILFAFLYEAVKVRDGFLLYILPGIAVSFIVGVFALKLLRNFVLSKKLWWFGIYCWIVAAVVCSLIGRL